MLMRLKLPFGRRHHRSLQNLNTTDEKPAISADTSNSEASNSNFSPSRKYSLRFESEFTRKLLVLSKKDVKNLEKIWQTRIHPGSSLKTPQKVYAFADVSPIWLDIFERVLTSKPQLKVALDMEDLATDQLRQSWKFRWHCQNFGRFWEAAFRLLMKESIDRENVSAFFRSVYNIGAKHSKNKAVSFDASTWLLFKNSLFHFLCPKTSSSEYESLNKLVTFVVCEMKWAFLDNVRKNSIVQRPAKGANSMSAPNIHDVCHVDQDTLEYLEKKFRSPSLLE